MCFEKPLECVLVSAIWVKELVCPLLLWYVHILCEIWALPGYEKQKEVALNCTTIQAIPITSLTQSTSCSACIQVERCCWFQIFLNYYRCWNLYCLSFVIVLIYTAKHYKATVSASSFFKSAAHALTVLKTLTISTVESL